MRSSGVGRLAPINQAKRVALETYDSDSSNDEEKSINHRRSLHKDLARMWHTKESSDMEVQCSDGVIKVHRLILSARSEVFRTMFECGLSESMSNRVKVTDFNLETMNVLLKYLYTGVVGKLTIQGISDLLRAADKYQLNSLKNECFKLLMAQLTLDNTAEIIQLAHVYSAPSEIKFQLQNHLIKNRLDLWKIPEFKLAAEAIPGVFNSFVFDTFFVPQPTQLRGSLTILESRNNKAQLLIQR